MGKPIPEAVGDVLAEMMGRSRQCEEYAERITAALAAARQQGQQSRPSRAIAEIVIGAYLMRTLGAEPGFELLEDGDDGWAFWVTEDGAEGDTTSYLHADLRVEWLGTSWEPAAQQQGQAVACDKCGDTKQEFNYNGDGPYPCRHCTTASQLMQQGGGEVDDTLTLADVAGTIGEIAEGFDGGEYAVSDETRRVLIDFASGLPDHPLFAVVGHYFAQNPVAHSAPQSAPVGVGAISEDGIAKIAWQAGFDLEKEDAEGEPTDDWQWLSSDGENMFPDLVKFARKIAALAQQPAAVDEALDRMRQAPNRLWVADIVGQQISVERMRDILAFALATQHQESTT